MKKIFIFISSLLITASAAVSAQAANNWDVTSPAGGTAEFSTAEKYDGRQSLHVQNNTEEVTVSHLIGATGSVKRTYEVTFYAKGTYNEDDIWVGSGTKTTGANLVITYMPISHEKVVKTSVGEWTKYSYQFRANLGNNETFKFVFASGDKDVYIDNASIKFAESTEETGWRVTDQSILGEGSFEDEPTGESIANYGWSSNITDVMKNSPLGATSVEPKAEVVEDENGNKMLFARYNYNGWSSAGLVLKKTMGRTGWEWFYVSFKIKGDYYPAQTEVGSIFDDRLVKLVGGCGSDAAGSSAEDPYGNLVECEQLEDGWTKYTVKTYGEGNVFRIKFNGGCLGVYLDDFEAWTENGTKLTVENGSFDMLDYDENKVFAEKWTASSNDASSFVQRDLFKGGYAVFMANSQKSTTASFNQTIDGLESGKSYTVSFDATTFFENASFKAGFGTDAATFTGVKSSDMTKSGNRYTFTATADGDELIIASAGVVDGLWIDNVSVKDENGAELAVNGDFSMKTQPPEYYTGDYKLYAGTTETTIGSGVNSVKIDVENNFRTDNDMEFTLIASHVRDKKTINITQASVTLAANGDTDDATSLSCPIDLSTWQDGDILEVFLWDNTDDKTQLKPFAVFGGAVTDEE